MRYCVFIFVSALLMTSCARWKKEKPTICVMVDEVPSKLLSKQSTNTSDASTKLTIQLSSIEEPSDHNYTRFKIKSLEDSIRYGSFNESGFVELDMLKGTYSIELKTISLVHFKLDSLSILPGTKTALEIQIGKPREFISVQPR